MSITHSNIGGAGRRRGGGGGGACYSLSPLPPTAYNSVKIARVIQTKAPHRGGGGRDGGGVRSAHEVHTDTAK